MQTGAVAMTASTDLKAVWEQAKEDTSEARRAVSKARKQLERAESLLSKAYDSERLCWIAYRDSKPSLADSLGIEKQTEIQ